MAAGGKAVGQRRFPLEYERYIRVLAAVPFGLAAYCLKTDYGFMGVLLIVILYTLRTEPQLRTAVCIVFYFVCIWISMALRLCVAIFLINRYNGEKGSGSEKIFYLFYPLHLLVIPGIKMAVGLCRNEMVQKSYGCRLRMKKTTYDLRTERMDYILLTHMPITTMRHLTRTGRKSSRD